MASTLSGEPLPPPLLLFPSNCGATDACGRGHTAGPWPPLPGGVPPCGKGAKKAVAAAAAGDRWVPSLCPTPLSLPHSAGATAVSRKGEGARSKPMPPPLLLLLLHEPSLPMLTGGLPAAAGPTPAPPLLFKAVAALAAAALVGCFWLAAGVLLLGCWCNILDTSRSAPRGARSGCCGGGSSEGCCGGCAAAAAAPALMFSLMCREGGGRGAGCETAAAAASASQGLLLGVGSGYRAWWKGALAAAAAVSWLRCCMQKHARIHIQ
eukprot:1145833-Pelagomonas_calceolata.AAC.2